MQGRGRQGRDVLACTLSEERDEEWPSGPFIGRRTANIDLIEAQL